MDIHQKISHMLETFVQFIESLNYKYPIFLLYCLFKPVGSSYRMLYLSLLKSV